MRKLLSGWKIVGLATRLVYCCKQLNLKLRRATCQVFAPAVHVTWQHASLSGWYIEKASVDGSAPIGDAALTQVSHVPRPPCDYFSMH